MKILGNALISRTNNGQSHGSSSSKVSVTIYLIQSGGSQKHMYTYDAAIVSVTFCVFDRMVVGSLMFYTKSLPSIPYEFQPERPIDDTAYGAVYPHDSYLSVYSYRNGGYCYILEQ